MPDQNQPAAIPKQTSDTELLRLFSDLGFIAGPIAMVPVLRLAYKCAYVSDTTVRIEGETGTGKSALALAIHRLDRKRCAFPFVTVHCSTISDSLAESELFGHRRGAFSGAASDRQGLFQAANRGTLFLDDVHELPLRLQPKLLDVLQRGVVRAVGSDREQVVDVRIVAASHGALAPLVREHRFRADLYHRLNVIALTLPPLRERPEDLPALLIALARRHSGLYQPIDGVEPDLLRILDTQRLDGNVRELDNVVQRILFSKTSGHTLSLADWMQQDLPAVSQGNPDLVTDAAQTLWRAIGSGEMSYAEAFRDVERKLLAIALRAGASTRRELAKMLHTSERTLYHKMRMYHLGH